MAKSSNESKRPRKLAPGKARANRLRRKKRLDAAARSSAEELQRWRVT